MLVSANSGERFEFYFPVKVHFEKHAVDRLGDFAGPAQRILIVTGLGSARQSGLLPRANLSLAPRAVTVFDQVESNPSIETVDRGANVAAEFGADLVVGLGGGSAMDAAKAIAALAPNSRSFRMELGKPAFAHPPIRLIAIPTTCGTGSEVNPYAIVTDTQANDKINFSNPQTWPALALLDPTVLSDIPRDVMVSTALDAFTHAFEGFTSRRSQPFSDGLALQAMGLILHHLPLAYQGDAESRGNLLYASSLAGIVIAHTGTTVLHALGYYLTLRHNIPHGRANATLIPLLMDYLQRHIPQKVSAVLELFPNSIDDIGGVRDYLHRLGVETKFSSLGVAPGELPRWAEYAIAKKNTPATVGAIDRDSLLKLLQKYE